MENRSLYWIDKARVWASVAVVVIHVNAIFINVYGKEIPAFRSTAMFTGSFVRWAVPLFVMISGFLLLASPEESLATFINKKLKRILYPLVGWCAVYYIYFVLRARYFGGSPPLASNLVNNFLLAKPYFHLYFLFLILGLYMITPALKLFVKNADQATIKYITLFSILVAVIPVTLDYFLPNEWFSARVLDNNSMFNYFVEYMGYFLAGFYIVRYIGISMKNAMWAWVLLAASIVFTICCSLYFNDTGYSYSYLGINVVCMSLSVFYLFIYYNGAFSQVSEKIVRFIAPNTLGIYLVHPIIFELFPALHRICFGLGPVMGTLTIVAGVYFISLILIIIARKIPFIKLFV